MRLFLLGLLACSSPQKDPQLEALRSALQFWEAGVEYMERGQPHEAQVAFKEALREDPDDLILKVWWAKSLAAAGHLEAAARVLDAVLIEEPGFVEARYNKAAYLTRMGKVDEAAPELHKALDEGAATSYDVLDDPDFQEWLDDPAFSFLPRTSMVLNLEGPRGSVFLGDEFGLTLRVFGADKAALKVEFRNASGPVELVSVQEDRVNSTAGPVRDVEFRTCEDR